jgi:hypothetical protein
MIVPCPVRKDWIKYIMISGGKDGITKEAAFSCKHQKKKIS